MKYLLILLLLAAPVYGQTEYDYGDSTSSPDYDFVTGAYLGLSQLDNVFVVPSGWVYTIVRMGVWASESGSGSATLGIGLYKYISGSITDWSLYYLDTVTIDGVAMAKYNITGLDVDLVQGSYKLTAGSEVGNVKIASTLWGDEGPEFLIDTVNVDPPAIFDITASSKTTHHEYDIWFVYTKTELPSGGQVIPVTIGCTGIEAMKFAQQVNWRDQ